MISEDIFNELESKHYEVENKLPALDKSLQRKQNDDSWDQRLYEQEINYKILHKSITP